MRFTRREARRRASIISTATSTSKTSSCWRARANSCVPRVLSNVISNTSNMSPPQDPSPILQTAFGFWSSKVLLTAVEMGVFTKLAHRQLTGAELGSQLGLHPRGVKDFFD